MAGYELSPINSRDIEVKTWNGKAVQTIQLVRSSYQAAYYAARLMGYKNISEMEQAMFPENN